MIGVDVAGNGAAGLARQASLALLRPSCFAVAATRLAEVRASAELGRSPVAPLLLTEALLLALFVATSLHAGARHRPPRHPLRSWPACWPWMPASGHPETHCHGLRQAGSWSDYDHDRQHDADRHRPCGSPRPLPERSVDTIRRRLRKMGSRQLAAFAAGGRSSCGALGYARLSAWCVLAAYRAARRGSAFRPGGAASHIRGKSERVVSVSAPPPGHSLRRIRSPYNFGDLLLGTYRRAGER
ncbi:hypothetical protein ACTMU2_18935 [Cupriavidus basilensis]